MLSCRCVSNSLSARVVTGYHCMKNLWWKSLKNMLWFRGSQKLWNTVLSYFLMRSTSCAFDLTESLMIWFTWPKDIFNKRGKSIVRNQDPAYSQWMIGIYHHGMIVFRLRRRLSERPAIGSWSTLLQSKNNILYILFSCFKDETDSLRCRNGYK